MYGIWVLNPNINKAITFLPFFVAFRDIVELKETLNDILIVTEPSSNDWLETMKDPLPGKQLQLRYQPSMSNLRSELQWLNPLSKMLLA